MCICLVTQSCLTLCDPARLLRPWASPGKNTGVGFRFLLQGDLPNPRIESKFPSLQADSLPSEPQGSLENKWTLCFGDAAAPPLALSCSCPGGPEMLTSVPYLPDPFLLHLTWPLQASPSHLLLAFSQHLLTSDPLCLLSGPSSSLDPLPCLVSPEPPCASPQKRDSDFSPTPQALGKSLTLSGPLLANLGNQKVKGDHEVPFGLRAVKLHTLFPGRLF